MLQRYTIKSDFSLDGDIYLEGSTFLHENETVGKMLSDIGIVTVKTESIVNDTKTDKTEKRITIEVEEPAPFNPYETKIYLSQMNMTELKMAAKIDGVNVDGCKTKKEMIRKIKAFNNKRG